MIRYSNRPAPYPYTPGIEFQLGATGLWLADGSPDKRYGSERLAGYYISVPTVSPVPGPGTSAAFVLDLSNGAYAGNELVLNTSFDSDISDWDNRFLTAFNWDNGSLHAEGSTAGAGPYSNPFSVIGGRQYLITLRIKSDRVYTDRYQVGFRRSSALNVFNGQYLLFSTNTEYQTIQTIVTPGVDAPDSVLFIWFGTGGGNINIDYASVKELPGNHAIQITGAARPTLGYNSENGKYHWSPDGADSWEVNGSVGNLSGDFEIHTAVRWSGSGAVSLISMMDTNHTETS